ncbi:MAG: sugar transferase [Bryobacter sp.]|nr:sugar transferase [Bryobacter sp.]
MFSRHHRKVRVLFAVSDILLIALAFQAAYWIRLLLPFPNVFFLTTPIKALLLAISMMSWVFLGYWFDLYVRLESAHPVVVLRDAFRQCALGAVVLVLVEFLLRLDLSRPFLLLFAALSWVFLSLFRLNAARLVSVIRREFGKPFYVLVVGVNERARALAASLEQSPEYGIRLLGFLDEKNARSTEGDYPVWPLAELPEILKRQIVDEIVFAVSSEQLKDLENIFLLCDEEGVRTHIAVDVFPHVHSRVYLDRLGDAPLLTFSGAPHDEVRLFLKRATDVVLAATALIVLAPFLVLIALLIRLTSPGAAIFQQERCGLNGRRFRLYKFRSMVADAEQRKAELEHLNQRDTVFKIPNDPRLTPLGRFLRKFSVDELPQLWNVLRGDMSLVGPRPAVPEEVERYQRWQRRRLRMRPGLTCLWALSGRDAVDFETWMRLDMEYIDNWSLALDWKIILRTIPQVVLGKGAH